MAWPQTTWVSINIVLTLTIILSVMIILFIMLRFCDSFFYGLALKVLNIKRCPLDVNNNPIDEESKPKYNQRHENLDRNDSTPSQKKQDSPLLVSGKVLKQAWESNIRVRTGTKTNAERAAVIGASVTQAVNVGKEMVSNAQKKNFDQDDPTSPYFRRIVLNVYGKYLPLRKKRNRLLLILILTVVISAVLLSFYEGCILTSITIYEFNPCPDYSKTDCYYGDNAKHFECQRDGAIPVSLGNKSAVCYRWVINDQSVHTILTRIGICGGLLGVLASVVEFLLKVLLFIFQKRRCVATGMEKIVKKTVGLNGVTQPCCLCSSNCQFLPCRSIHFSTYELPWVARIVFLSYLITILIVAVIIALLPYNRWSQGAYTYIILISTLLICLLCMVWVLWEHDELSKCSLGGRISLSDILESELFKKALNEINSAVASGINKNGNDKNSKTNAAADPSNNDESSETNSAADPSSDDESSENSPIWSLETLISCLQGLKCNFTKSEKKTENLTLSEEVIANLIHVTNFNEKEIRQWHEGFLEDCPDGKLTEEKCKEIFKKCINPRDSVANAFCKYLFKVFDKDKNKCITFPEFLIAIAPNTVGKPEECIELAFYFYDTDNSKSISEKELQKWMEEMYEVTNFNVNGKKRYKHEAKKIMKEIDENGDKKISLDELKTGYEKSSDLREILQINKHNNRVITINEGVRKKK